MKHILFFALISLVLSSCIKNNPDPSWLEVNEWTLIENPNYAYFQGELTHNFTDAWVFVDDKVIGVFEVPFKIPILKDGNVNIKIYPAIRNNGISATKKIYPFVEVYEINADLVKNEVLTLNPITQYISSTHFWIEDFEDPGLDITDDINSATNIQTGNDPLILKWGNAYGEVNLTTTDSTWVAYTTNQLGNMVLPKGQEVYLEIDYYNTNSLVTGVLAISPTSVKNNQNIMLNAQNPSSVKWKKIYIDLKEIISNSAGANQFSQSFQANLDKGDTEGLIILDNVKIVHF
jgi:hypothetical protein